MGHCSQEIENYSDLGNNTTQLKFIVASVVKRNQFQTYFRHLRLINAQVSRVKVSSFNALKHLIVIYVSYVTSNKNMFFKCVIIRKALN